MRTLKELEIVPVQPLIERVHFEPRGACALALQYAQILDYDYSEACGIPSQFGYLELIVPIWILKVRYFLEEIP